LEESVLQTLREFFSEAALRVTGSCHSDADPRRAALEESVLQTLREFFSEAALRVTGSCHSDADPRRAALEESVFLQFEVFPQYPFDAFLKRQEIAGHGTLPQ
jgi:arginine/ornithine N-succinyltransferase beta subunit